MGMNLKEAFKDRKELTPMFELNYLLIYTTAQKWKLQ